MGDEIVESIEVFMTSATILFPVNPGVNNLKRTAFKKTFKCYFRTILLLLFCIKLFASCVCVKPRLYSIYKTMNLVFI